MKGALKILLYVFLIVFIILLYKAIAESDMPFWLKLFLLR